MLRWDSADINHLGVEIAESAAARDRDEFGAIVVHPLGLDDCKDRGLPMDVAMLVFRRLKRVTLEKDRNIVVTEDHSGEAAVPLFAPLTTIARVDLPP